MPDIQQQQDSIVAADTSDPVLRDTIDPVPEPVVDTPPIVTDTSEKVTSEEVMIREKQQKTRPDTVKSDQKTTTPGPTKEQHQVDSGQILYPVDQDHSFIHSIPVRKIRPGENLFPSEKTRQQEEISIREIPRIQKLRDFSTNWFSLTLYAIIILCYIWLQFFNKKYVYEFIRSTFNFQLGQKLFRDRNILVKRVLFILDLIFYLSISQFILQILDQYNNPVHSSRLLSFILVLLSLIGLIQAKRMILFVTGKLFMIDTVLHEYLFNAHLVNKTLGLILLPITILITYIELDISQILVVTGIILFFLGTVLKYIKGLKIILRHNIYLYHIILYLCTLEILPVLIGIKFFVYIS